MPYEDSIGALIELQAAGKINHIGVSNVTEAQLRQAQALTPIVSVQNRFNLGDRNSDAVVTACESDGIAFLPWAPIQNHDEHPALSAIAARHGVPDRQVVLAWLLARSPVMVPIPGTGSVSHLDDNVAAARLVLSDDETAELSLA